MKKLAKSLSALFLKGYRHLEPQEHAAGVVVKHIKAGHHLADIVPRNLVIIPQAILPKLLGTGDFIVVVVQIDAGVHAAFHRLARGEASLLPAAQKDEDVLCQKTSSGKILLGNGGADVVGMDLGKAPVLQLAAQLPQNALIGVNPVAVKVGGTGNSPGKPPVNVLQGQGAGGGRFAVPLDGEDGPLHGVVLGLELAHLLMDLLVFLGEQLFNQGDILLLQHLGDLSQAHAQLLHIDDHVQAGVLVDVVIAVSGLRIDIPGLEQALFIVQPQGGNGHPVQRRHFPDGQQRVFHKAFPLVNSILGVEFTPLYAKAQASPPKNGFPREQTKRAAQATPYRSLLERTASLLFHKPVVNSLDKLNGSLDVQAVKRFHKGIKLVHRNRAGDKLGGALLDERVDVRHNLSIM